jgi:hypothetical protein
MEGSPEAEAAPKRRIVAIPDSDVRSLHVRGAFFFSFFFFSFFGGVSHLLLH